MRTIVYCDYCKQWMAIFLKKSPKQSKKILSGTFFNFGFPSLVDWSVDEKVDKCNGTWSPPPPVIKLQSH